MENGRLCTGHRELGELGEHAFLCTDLGDKNSPANVDCFLAVSRQCPENEKGHFKKWPNHLILLVGREWIEHSTYGLRVRCSTN